MKNWTLLAALLLISGTAMLCAEDKVTVQATGEDISEGLDLKAVATLFGEVKDLNEFEQKLNSEDLHLNNLDLNGDGTVDYLRVVESKDGDNHLVLIQAILAKDIFQDVASVFVEHQGNDNVSVQVIGDEYVYGTNYVIEPVYIYRPLIYDWFWGPAWVCWTSPWYWGYWPGWYAPYPCWGYHDYWVHIHVYHHDHPACSYRYARGCSSRAAEMRRDVSRSDYARSSAGRSFASRTGKTNARDLNTSRAVSRSSSPSSATRSLAPVATRSSTPSATAVTRSSAASRGTAIPSRSSYSGGYSGTPSRSSYSGGGASRSSYSGGGASRSSYSGGGASRSSYSGGGASRSSYSGGGASRSSYSGGGASRSTRH